MTHGDFASAEPLYVEVLAIGRRLAAGHPEVEEVRGAELRRTRSQPATLFDVGTFLPFAAGRNIEAQFNPTDVGVRVNALGVNGFNIPSLLSVHQTPPYFHHGAAQTLDEVLNGAHDQNGTSPLKGVHRVADATQRANLIEFLESIDETATIFQ